MNSGNKQLTDPVLEAINALEAGWVMPEDVRRAHAARHWARPQLGKLAMKLGKLTVAQMFKVLGQQAAVGGMFGQTAVKLGYFSHGDLYELLQAQSDLTPSLGDTLCELGLITEEQARCLAQQSHIVQPVLTETPLSELPC